MLLGTNFAFVHIPKCGGGSVRHALRHVSTREVGEVNPMGQHATTSHAFHQMPRTLDDINTFAIVREPVAWLRSYWDMRMQEGDLDQDKVLDRIFSPDLYKFCRAVLDFWPDYPSQLMLRYAHYIPGTFVYRLEYDGVARVCQRLGVRATRRVNSGKKLRQSFFSTRVAEELRHHNKAFRQLFGYETKT